MTSPVATAPELAQALRSLDLAAARTTYRAQDEFLFLPRFIPGPLVDRMREDVERVRPLVHRNYIPRHKKGGSVSYYALMEHAPEIVSLYRSPDMLAFVRDLVGVPVQVCPDRDPHSCALYFYTEPGDHIGLHYDTSYYRGTRFTILIGLIDRSSSRLVCRLHTRNPPHAVEELALATDPGSFVIFNGDRLHHAITPLGEGEERVSLTLEYVTSQEMGRAKRLFSDLKDAFAYFGFAELIRGRRKSPRATRQ
jgi:alkylated DNA repair dioxygenase AlkB